MMTLISDLITYFAPFLWPLTQCGIPEVTRCTESFHSHIDLHQIQGMCTLPTKQSYAQVKSDIIW